MFTVGAVVCALAAAIIGIVLDQTVLALGLALGFYVLFAIAVSHHSERQGARSLQDRARAATAKQEAMLRELEAAQARRRRALCTALGLDES